MTGPVTDAELTDWIRGFDPRDGSIRITAEQLARVQARIDAQRHAGDAIDEALRQMCRAHATAPTTLALVRHSLAMRACWKAAR